MNNRKESKFERFAVFKDLGVLEYKKTLELQTKTMQGKIDQTIKEDHIFFVEHPSVFTLGKRGGSENLTVSKKFLSEQNIDLVQTKRGGNITWHGPGQAVLYPIIDLEKKKIAVKDFVYGLEEIMKLTVETFNINASRDKKNHGLWVDNAKIGNVGISISKGVSMHGLSLNINPDLTPFSWINPCGLNDISITSIEKLIMKTSDCKQTNPFSSGDIMAQIKRSFKKYFSYLFDFKIVEMD